MKLRPALLPALATAVTFAAAPATGFARLRDQVAALGNLTSPPAVHAAEGFAPTKQARIDWL